MYDTGMSKGVESAPAAIAPQVDGCVLTVVAGLFLRCHCQAKAVARLSAQPIVSYGDWHTTHWPTINLTSAEPNTAKFPDVGPGSARGRPADLTD